MARVETFAQGAQQVKEKLRPALKPNVKRPAAPPPVEDDEPTPPDLRRRDKPNVEPMMQAKKPGKDDDMSGEGVASCCKHVESI